MRPVNPSTDGDGYPVDGLDPSGTRPSQALAQALDGRVTACRDGPSTRRNDGWVEALILRRSLLVTRLSTFLEHWSLGAALRDSYRRRLLLESGAHCSFPTPPRGDPLLHGKKRAKTGGRVEGVFWDVTNAAARPAALLDAHDKDAGKEKGKEGGAKDKWWSLARARKDTGGKGKEGVAKDKWWSFARAHGRGGRRVRGFPPPSSSTSPHTHARLHIDPPVSAHICAPLHLDAAPRDAHHFSIPPACVTCNPNCTSVPASSPAADGHSLPTINPSPRVPRLREKRAILPSPSERRVEDSGDSACLRACAPRHAFYRWAAHRIQRVIHHLLCTPASDSPTLRPLTLSSFETT
ncbi:hypothetical protein FB451DRAFT_1522029 [Mycena latifolia]|nr:hypothetical protein FB451DRAFT_1522029 [Mycena latifolia]